MEQNGKIDHYSKIWDRENSFENIHSVGGNAGVVEANEPVSDFAQTLLER